MRDATRVQSHLGRVEWSLMLLVAVWDQREIENVPSQPGRAPKGQTNTLQVFPPNRHKGRGLCAGIVKQIGYSLITGHESSPLW